MALFRRPHARPRAAVTHLSAAARRQMRDRGRRAARQAALMLPLAVGVLVLYRYRISLTGLDAPVRVACSLALVALGWWFARDVGRAASPALFRRLEPSTAGTMSFLIRFALLALALVVALRTAGLDPRTLAVGGAFTAV